MQRLSQATTAPHQLPLALAEASRYHRPSRRDPYISWNYRERGAKRMRQYCVPVSRMGWLLGQIGRRSDWTHEHHYISQAEFTTHNRRAVNLWRLGLLWADIDLHSIDFGAATIDRETARLLHVCDDLGIPPPSLIVWSGRGIHAKWVLDAPLPAPALPRWTAAMRFLHDKLCSAGLPVDRQAKDVSRVLRIAGTNNPRPSLGGYELRPVVVSHEGQSYGFNELCEYLLPYTREQVEQFRRDKQARAEAHAEWQQWDENRARAAAARAGRVITLSADAEAGLEATAGMWGHRLTGARDIARSRGGIPPGERNNWMWVVANAAAWAIGDAGRLWLEIPALAREIAPTYTPEEAWNSGISVYRRLRDGGPGDLYKMKTSTIARLLGLSASEVDRLTMRQGHDRGQEGKLALEPIKGLEYSEYLAETKRRQALGAQHATAVRERSGPALDLDRVAKARQMRSEGLSIRAISKEMGVPKSTVSDWIR